MPSSQTCESVWLLMACPIPKTLGSCWAFLAWASRSTHVAGGGVSPAWPGRSSRALRMKPCKPEGGGWPPPVGAQHVLGGGADPPAVGLLGLLGEVGDVEQLAARAQLDPAGLDDVRRRPGLHGRGD